MARGGLLHVLGGGPWQVLTVRLAKSMGYCVLVTDCFSERPAYAIADYHEVVDITDRDATLAQSRRYGIDGIICDTTDVGVPTAAYVAEQLGLPGMGYEVALNFVDKGRMRQLTERAGLKTPQHRVAKTEEKATEAFRQLGAPVVVKPTDSQSGKGVTIVTHSTELLGAFAHARAHGRRGTVLIEELVRGVEFIVDGFVLDGEIRVLGVARKTPHPLQPTVAKRITYCEEFPGETIQQLEAASRRAIAALGLRAGIFHSEYMLSGGDVVPIDIAARGGGCMIYTHVLPFVSGFDANRAMISLAMGERPTVLTMRRKAANIEFFDLPNGVLQQIDGTDEARHMPGVLGLHVGVAVGDQIGALRKKDDRPGYIVTGGDTADAAIHAAREALTSLRVRMQGDDGLLPVI